MAGGKRAFGGNQKRQGEHPGCVADVGELLSCTTTAQVAITTDALRTSVFLHVAPLLGCIRIPSHVACSRSSGSYIVSLGLRYECPKRQGVEIAKLRRSGHPNWQSFPSTIFCLYRVHQVQGERTPLQHSISKECVKIFLP